MKPSPVFFVDRKVPADNVFWKDRLLYITRGNGYISIPVYYDLLFRLGLPQSLLLDEKHIQLMEAIMHYAIREEYKEISFETQLGEIKQLLSHRIQNTGFYNRLVGYLEQPVLKPAENLGMPVPSLNRADVFLFILCDLTMTDEQIDSAVTYWYALHTSYLLMDDMYDYKLDKQDAEENAILELGDGQTGFDKAFEILNDNIKTMRMISPVLSDYLSKSLEILHGYAS